MRYRRFTRLLFTLLAPLLAVTAVFAVSATPARLQTAVVTSPLDVVISEIAWMGTTSSSTDEWLELRNNTATAPGDWFADTQLEQSHTIVNAVFKRMEYDYLGAC